MILNLVPVFVLIIGTSAQSVYRLCATPDMQSLCQAVDKGDSRVTCEMVATKMDCPLKLARNQADIGVFSEEEMLLIAQQQPNEHRVVASIRHVNKPEQFAFEAVAVVPVNHTGGLDGLRNARYCHPGLDQSELRWSPRVLKTFERQVARTDRCVEPDTRFNTFEELEASTLSAYFGAACRPGRWSANDTIDARLKQEYPNLCTLCSGNGTSDCTGGYRFDMGIQVAPVSNTNRHIQALECLTRYNGTVAYVAWQHVTEYFLNRRSDMIPNYALLCDDGAIRPLTPENLLSNTSACAWVRQPWGAILSNPTRAANLLAEIRTWWPNGVNPNNGNWQSEIFNHLIGGADVRVNFEDGTPNALNYTSAARNMTDIDAMNFCMPAQRWCTVSDLEQSKCNLIRRAAYTLGIEPAVSCQQRPDHLRCLEDIRESRADFIAIDSNYGYLARQIYKLSPVMLLQNTRTAFSRVAALVRHNSQITRFENLRGVKACFPEYGGIAFVSFVVAAHDRSILSRSECDYGRAVAEFFDGACAPGATDEMHNLFNNGYNASSLCSVCKSAYNVMGNWNQETCAADYSNLYYGNNGTLACLADEAAEIVFLETQNLQAYLSNLSLQASSFRALCHNNNSLGAPGVTITDDCLLSLVIDSEVLARRNDPQLNSLGSLLDHLDRNFGYALSRSNQHIQLEIYSPFDGTSDLLFKDSVIGLTSPSTNATHDPARNYFQLFQHLEGCTGSADGLATKGGLFSMVSLVLVSIISKWLV